MELVVIPAAVAFVGKYLNKEGKQPREDLQSLTRNSVSQNEIPSGTGMRPYDSKRSDFVLNEEYKRANKYFIDSLDPINTNVIPPHFNEIAQKTILPQAELYNPNKKEKIYNGPMFNIVENFTLNEMKKNIDISELKKYNPNVQISELTGEVLDPRHSNMTPHFGSTVKQNLDPSLNERKLDNFTGVGLTSNIHKKEVGNMFELQKENVFRMPNVPEDYRKSRYNISNTKNSLLPIKQIRVKPIDEAEEIVRPEYKTVDQLRSKNNPKITYQGRAVAPPKAGEKRPVVAKLRKNRPPTTFDIGGKFLIANSSYKKPKLKENFSEMKMPVRDGTENANYRGNASSQFKGYTLHARRVKR